MQRKLLSAMAAVLLIVTVAYANFFSSVLHLTEYAAVRDNPAIRNLHNIPRFFYDPSTASVNPQEYSYQPIVTASLAFDYALGRGVSPLFLHLGTFLLFLAGLAAIAWFCHSVFEHAIPHPWNPYLALLVTALVGLHPATAELLNPIAKRGELFAALSIIAGLAMYAGLPRQRRFFFYLVPPLFGIFANPAALVFGPMLLAYMILIEPPPSPDQEPTQSREQNRPEDPTSQPEAQSKPGAGPKRIRIRRRKHPFLRYVKVQAKRFMPALLFSVLGGLFHSKVTLIESPGETVIRYWFTQPWVALRYLRSFFAPFYFSPASDLAAFPGYDIRGVFGVGLVLLLISVALIVAVSRTWRPAVFAIWWFLLGVLPGAVLVQPFVESDSRMFLPFIGIAMGLAWTARMLLPSGEPLRRLEAIVAVLLILALAYEARVRNRIWSSDETLWRDAITKSPASARALEEYGLALAAKGRTQEAYDYLERARQLAPESAEIEMHLGTLAASLRDDEEAERHFRRALATGADQPATHFEYAAFLEHAGRIEKAIESYDWAASLALTDLRPRFAMMRLYEKTANWYGLRQAVESAGSIGRGDPTVAGYAALLRNHPDTVKGAEELIRQNPTAENYLILSEAHFLTGDYQKSLEAAKKAIELKPGSSAAYNDMGAAYVSMGRIDEGISAVREALKIDPDNQRARVNLVEWQKEKLLASEEIMRK